MVWCLLTINDVLETISYIISFDFLTKLGKNALGLVRNSMGRVAKAKREAATKRLRRPRKRLEDCKMVKRKLCRRNCINRLHTRKNRVLEPDYLANLAYQRRLSDDNQSPTDLISPESLTILKEPKNPQDDHRDLPQLNYNEVAWWTGVNKRIQMPSLRNEELTRSNCSSTSSFHSATFDIIASSQSSIDTSTNSDSSNYE